MKVVKYIGIALVALIATLAVFVVVYIRADARDAYPEITTDDVTIPEFTPVAVPFTNEFNAEKSLPFMASAVIDVDNDGTEEVFFGGGFNQQDGLVAFQDGKFVDITEGKGLTKGDNDTTYGSVALDADQDGFTDLIVARQSGVWLYTNRNGTFTGKNLNVPLNEKTVPLSVAVTDLNRDGHFDMYVSGYIKLSEVEGQTIFLDDSYGGSSELLLNNGDNTFRRITQAAGIEYVHNTFHGVFVDVDNDGLEDLVVAHDTGHVRTYKNLGGLKFEVVPNPNSNQYSYPMGVAVGDYNNDGNVDFFFSNVGTTTPEFMVMGDLGPEHDFNPRWMLFQGTGNFQFTDVAHEAKVANFEFSWGASFEDLNLDGRPDLLVSENYVGLPWQALSFLRLPGRLLLQKPNGRFAAAGGAAGVVNEHFSIAPITADFNQDGYPDIVHVNLAGTGRAFLSQGGNATYLKVKLPETTASIGARVSVTTAAGKTYNQPYVSGEGLCSDSSRTLIFGLDGARTIQNVTIQYLGGRTRTIAAPTVNTTVVVN